MQNAIMNALQTRPDMAYFELARALFGDQETESQRASMRRAIAALQRKRKIKTRVFWINEYGIAHSGMSVQLVQVDHDATV